MGSTAQTVPTVLAKPCGPCCQTGLNGSERWLMFIRPARPYPCLVLRLPAPATSRTSGAKSQRNHSQITGGARVQAGPYLPL